jgi:hypothetical protein
LFAFEYRTITPLKIPNLGYFKIDVLSWPITVINYANDKGMKVAVDFSLGYHNGYPSKAMLNDIRANLIKIKDN